MSDAAMPLSWERFAPFSREDLARESERFSQVEKELAVAWEEECTKYEETMAVEIDGKTMQVPRRNYINKEARVVDPALFPYHSSCYSLLDAYDNLYHTQEEQPVSKDAIPAQCFPPPPIYFETPRADEDLQWFLPCSIRAIAGAIFRTSQVEGLLIDTEVIVAEYTNSLFEVNLYLGLPRPKFDCIHVVKQGFQRSLEQSGPVPFPTCPTTAQELLMKLLKHATSEIQRDHFLARAVLCRLVVEGHCEDIKCFRRVMVLLASEYFDCGLPCHEPEDHVCRDWEYFQACWRHIFGSHAMVLTTEHGLAMAGFVRHLFLREFSHLMRDTKHSVGEKMKNQLKRNLVLRREESEDPGKEDSSMAIPTKLVLEIITGLRERANKERERILKFLQTHDYSEEAGEAIQQSIESYLSCLSTLLTIADAIATTLPPVERFYDIASTIVAAIATCLVAEHSRAARFSDSYLGLHSGFDGLVCKPFRFAETVRQAATLREQRAFPFRESQSSRENLLNQCRQILYGRPADEIRVVVRQLFVRDMVDVEIARMGYGDFLVWCRYDVHPLDPALFCHEFNYHVGENESEDEDDDEEDEEDYQWDVDEDGNFLSESEIRDHFDLSLLALQCAWHEPWSPESHPTYQPGFRAAVHQVALCLHHVGMPNELHGHIVQYFARDWWPDTRLSCFNFDCQLEQLRRQEECRDTGRVYVPPAAKFGDCCLVAYCSRSCRECDWKSGGHKRCCGKPPYSRPTTKEYRFCETIRRRIGSGRNGDKETTARDEAHRTVPMEEDQEEMLMDGDEVDDDDWESVDSSDEEFEEPSDAQRSSTALITEFFKAHYKDR